MTALSLPPIGLGTYGNAGDRCRRAVRTALELGYRHVDTAQMYDNERAVGAGLDAAAVPREDVVVATKVHPSNLAHDDVLRTVEASRDRLGVDVIDLLYVHWPTEAYDPDGTLAAFDELYDRGWIRAAGVSNFEPDQVDEAMDRLSAPLVANQVELHPLLPQEELRAYARRHDLTIVAYSPVLKGRAGEVPELVEVAERHGVTPTQVCLAWVTGLEGVVAVPKATGEAHLRENLAAADIDLEPVDRELLDDIDRRRRLVDRPDAPWHR